MKCFIEPNGLFLINIPIDWQYKNVLVGEKEISPFSFELYDNPIGAFQISCYQENEKIHNTNFKIHKYNQNNLDFVKERKVEDDFCLYFWFTKVENYFFIAKYIFDKVIEKNIEIIEELKKVEQSLMTLELISPDKRQDFLEFIKYENFIASLSASFDLKNKAIENKSLIELVILIANQIDAYLRMSIVLKKQITEKTNKFDFALLFQGENDTPIMERKIYSQAKELNIIDKETFDKLENLYKERNKVVHRYIISDFKTRYLFEIVYEYENICENIRLNLQKIEELQIKENKGIYRNTNKKGMELNFEDKRILFSQVNDKHLINELYR